MDIGYTFEINLTKSKYALKHVTEIPEIVSHAFERKIKIRDIGPLVGTDHVQKWPIREDKDIKEFMDAKSMMREAFVEKVIKFYLPHGIMPRKWKPKHVKILARGPLQSKYFGEDEVSTRQVEVSLKLFECGHFYMKQTLPGAGAMPYQIIFEGSWERNERGVHLVYRIRYTGQTSKKSELELRIEALPPNNESFLAIVDENENHLNGLVPAIVGEDDLCRIEIYREPDVVEKGKARFNEDDDDIIPPAQPTEPPPETAPRPTDMAERIERAERMEKADRADRQARAERQKAEKNETAATKTEAPQSAPEPHSTPEPQTPYFDDGYTKEDESMWPLLLGLLLFILLCLFFLYLNWFEGESESDDVEI